MLLMKVFTTTVENFTFEQYLEKIQGSFVTKRDS
jgi:hypothetical protein